MSESIILTNEGTKFPRSQKADSVGNAAGGLVVPPPVPMLIVRKRLVKPRVDSGGVKARAKFAPAAFGLNVVGSAPGNLTEQHNEKDENMDHHRSLSRLRS
jgi:hypothetical protein